MCGGGDLGGSNNKDNDNKKGSGNSAGEKLANAITPNDGFSYRDGRLTADRDRSTYTGVSSNPNEQHKNINVFDRSGKGSFFVPKNETKAYNDGIVRAAVIGGLTGGLGGVALGIGGNAVKNALFSGGGDGSRDRPAIKPMPRRPNTGGLGTVSDRFGNPITNLANAGPNNSAQMQNIRGILGKADAAAPASNKQKTGGGFFDFLSPHEFSTPELQAKFEEDHNRRVERQRQDRSDRPEQTVTTPTAVTPAAGSDMSAAAAQGGFKPVPNPDYDPNDPMSPRFLINPSYAQLLEYQQSQVAGMAMGGYLGMGRPGQVGYAKIQPSVSEAFAMRRPAYSEPLQQYGSYLESQYGDAGFDQKKDSFLQEVNNKEQQTFGQGGLGTLIQQPMDPRGPRNFQGFAELQSNIVDQGTFPQNLVRGFAPGGELEVAPQEGIAAVPQEGGNEKTDIVDAVRAVKGDMSKEEASVALGKFLATYGEEALKNLVEAVQSGELDDTIERFANGEAGEVNGPGDGSGVDDKVPASLEGQEDVLLADGEYVLRAKTAKALEKMYGGGFLDTINESEDNAPRVIRELAARTA